MSTCPHGVAAAHLCPDCFVAAARPRPVHHTFVMTPEQVRGIQSRNGFLEVDGLTIRRNGPGINVANPEWDLEARHGWRPFSVHFVPVKRHLMVCNCPGSRVISDDQWTTIYSMPCGHTPVVREVPCLEPG